MVINKRSITDCYICILIIIVEMYLQIQRNRSEIVKSEIMCKSVVMVEARAWQVGSCKQEILFSFLELHHSHI